MEIQKEILNNINKRYVLLKKGHYYLIIDKNRKTMVVIDDPLINFNLLIKTMLQKGAEVYKSLKDLPEAKEKLIKHVNIPKDYQLFIKHLYDQNGKETGAIISALTNKLINREEKERIEKLIENYAFTVLYPTEGLNLFSEIHGDTASMTIIKGLNNMPFENLDGELKTIYDW